MNDRAHVTYFKKKDKIAKMQKDLRMEGIEKSIGQIWGNG
jgi:hypothetical protein